MNISNNQKRYKATPIQAWRQNYNYISAQIRRLKDSSRSDGTWGEFKVRRQQQSIPVLQVMARDLMDRRAEAAAASRMIYADMHPDR